MDYTVTEYRKDDNKKVAQLHSHLIEAGWWFNRSYLRWKYEKNPFIQPPLLFVVRHGREVVGLRGLVGTYWNFGHQRESVVLPHADEMVVHPEHRNRGLFLLLNDATVTAARERGFPAMISLSGGEVTQELSLLAGWRTIGELDQLYRDPEERAQERSQPRVLRIRGGFRLQSILRRIGYTAWKLPSDRSVDSVSREWVSAGNKNIRISKEPDYAGMSSLAQSAAPHRVQGERSEAFFRWRLKNPDRKYRFLYWRDSSLRGYMVLAWSRPESNLVTIADYSVADEEVLRELLHALGRGRQNEYRLMSSTLPEAQRRLFGLSGFVPDPSHTRDQRRRFLYYPLAQDYPLAEASDVGVPELGSISYPAEWSISMMDTMRS